ncbi:MAG: HEAT repeat domain-containing protein [Planctomycetes bacterium]|nr:HEAT repeat domain-containing protein [Planctomycetota bacterium]
MRRFVRTLTAVILFASLAGPAPADEVGYERSPEWKAFLAAHESYRAFLSEHGRMGLEQETYRELEGRLQGVKEKIRGLSALVERDLLDEGAVRLLELTYEGPALAQTMAPQTDEQRRQLAGYFQGTAYSEVEECLPHLEAHVERGVYVEWLDRHLFLRLRREVESLRGVGAADLSYWSDTRHRDFATVEDVVRRAYGALNEGVWRLRAREIRVDPDLAARIRQLVSTLGDPSYETRSRAQEELASLGVAALPALLDAAGDPDPEVRERAGQLLARFHPSPAED